MENKNSILKGETVVDVQKLANLENTINLNNQTLGAKTAQINTLQEQINALKKEHTIALEKAQKEVIIRKGEPASKNGLLTCTNCGYRYYKNSANCPSCDTSTLRTDSSVTYKNLDDVVELIRKEESKKLKVDLNKLENDLLDLELEKENLEKKADRLMEKLNTAVEKENSAVREATKKLRDEHKKELESTENRIEELLTEIQKIKEDKTDALIEANRKAEIVELKNRIAELEKEMEELETLSTKPFNFKGLLQKRKNEKLAIKAAVEKEEKAKRIEDISKAYPDEDRSFWNFFSYPWGKEEDPYETKTPIRRAWDKFRNWF